MIRRRAWMTLLAIAGCALALRSLPLYWSSLPSTLDGFDYAHHATIALKSGHLEWTAMRADNFGYASFLAVGSTVLGFAPVHLAQPLASVTGTAAVLVSVGVVQRVLRVRYHRGFATRVALLTGALIAIEGLYLRRTLVPDEELLALTILPAFALCAWLLLRHGRMAWALPLGIFLGLYPLLHTFTSFIAALTLTAIVTLTALDRRTGLRQVGLGAVITGAFWGYLAAYYSLARDTGIFVPYVDRVTAYPGLFVAWLILLVIGGAWTTQTSRRGRQVVFLVPVIGVYLVLGINMIRTVFPGTASTPQRILLLVVPLLIPAVLASRGFGQVGNRYNNGGVLVALFLAPLVLIGFALTAALTPEYFATALRAQTFLHLPVLAFAAVSVGLLMWTQSDTTTSASPVSDTHRLGGGLLALLLLATAFTAPLAYMNMDTASYPSTTLESEFQAVQFGSTHLPGSYQTDHSLSRVGIHYFGANASYDETANWLTGGPPIQQPAISQRSWTTTGAHLFPAAPATVGTEQYQRWLHQRSVIYRAGGRDPAVISTPSRQTTATAQSYDTSDEGPQPNEATSVSDTSIRLIALTKAMERPEAAEDD